MLEAELELKPEADSGFRSLSLSFFFFFFFFDIFILSLGRFSSVCHLFPFIHPCGRQPSGDSAASRDRHRHVAGGRFGDSRIHSDWKMVGFSINIRRDCITRLEGGG